MPSEFKKPAIPPPPLPMTQVKLLSTQIAYKEKQEEVKSHQHIEQYSTPLTSKPPKLNEKLSPIDKIAPLTRIDTQKLIPIEEDEQKYVPEIIKDEICLNTIDDLEEDDLAY